MKNIKSKIHTSDMIHNTNRTERENQVYFFAYIYFDQFTKNPEPEPAMFTYKQIKDAMNRADRNPEDIPQPPEKKGVINRITDFMGNMFVNWR
jgi:hypothetical protein